MELKLTDYVTINDKGEPVFDQAKLNADVDRERNNASETAKNNAEKKLRPTLVAELKAQMEEEAKLSAEEKLAKQIEDFNAEKAKFSESQKAYNAERVRNLYKDSGLFADDELPIYAGFITDDFEKSTEIANKIIGNRKKYNENYDKQYKEKLQLEQTRTSGGGNSSADNSDIAKKARSYSQNNTEDVVEL